MESAYVRTVPHGAWTKQNGSHVFPVPLECSLVVPHIHFADSGWISNPLHCSYSWNMFSYLKPINTMNLTKRPVNLHMQWPWVLQLFCLMSHIK